MISNKILPAILIIGILLFSGLASAVFIQDNSPSNEGSLKKWTVMYYMCGDASFEIYLSPMIDRLSAVGSSEDLNIVVLMDKTVKGDSKLYYINELGVKVELNEEFGWEDEVDMSDLNTLELFCKQMMIEYPAEYYALITCTSAGPGWQKYTLEDKDCVGRKNSIPAFADSVKNIVEYVNHKIDVLFVSCAMNTIEMAYELSPYIDYIVGTQDCLTHNSIVPRFTDAVVDLGNDPSMSPEDFSKRAPFRYTAEPFYYYESYYGDLPLLSKILNKLPFEGLHTLIHFTSSSVINLSKIGELSKKLDDLCLNLIIDLKDKEIKEAVKRARKETQEYGNCYPKYPFLLRIYSKYSFNILSYDCVVDLYNFIEILRYYIDNDYLRSQCNSILNFYDEVIPAISKVSYDNSNGLNIYFPKTKRQYNKYVLPGKIPCPYEDLQFSENSKWDDFIKEYLSI